MRVWRFGIAVLLAATLCTPAVGRADSGVPQSAGGGVAAADLVDARRALDEGRYAQVEKLLAAAASTDAPRTVLRARAAIATGNYDQARDLLRAAVTHEPKGDAALELGLLQLRLGLRADASRSLTPLLTPDDNAPVPALLRAARAARALGEFEAANELFRQAAADAPQDPDVNIAWGELLLEKHNTDEAAKCFELALHANPRAADAWLGLARVAADRDTAAALGSVRHALEINPASVDAHVAMADLLLDAGYQDAAVESLRRALEVNSRSLEAHAYLAAIARLDNRAADFTASIDRALAINPHFGEAYRIVAAQLAAHYRFDEAVAMSRKAVATDADNGRAAAELGMNLLRTGDEDEARAVLKHAFDQDPYDVVTYNLLAVLDALQKFETVRDGDLVLRLDPKEASVLKEPALALAHEALTTLSAKYGFTPRGPILIEIFPHHDDFAVRNLGIPGLVGALGACFGRVVTMDSPRARPPGTFEWRATLWHELTHVVTLQMSAQRVPRWLTEGISVYEEQRARPEWRRPLDAVFARALDRNLVPAVADIDSGFADPRTIGLAYYQAGLIVDYLVETYGQQKFNAFVRAFADGVEAEGAVSRALGVDLGQVQEGFTKYLDKSFGRLRRALRTPAGVDIRAQSIAQLKTMATSHPESYDIQMALAAALRREDDIEGARAALTRAAELWPTAIGDDSPHALLAEIHIARGDRASAVGELEKQLTQDSDNIELARRITALLAEDQQPERLQHAYERIVALDPFDAEANAALGATAAKRGDAATAVRAFRAALAAGPSDAAATRCDLAEAYLLMSDVAQAKRQVLTVLEQAPTHERAQELLLKLVEGGR